MKHKLLFIIFFVGFCLFANNADAVLTSGDVTLKLAGGDYSTWTGFWNDLGNLTGDITLTVDDSAFTENTAPADVTESLGGYTLKVTAATFPSTTDGSTGPRITYNPNNEFLNLQMEGSGAVIIEGIVSTVTSVGSSARHYMFYNIVTTFTITLRRNILIQGLIPLFVWDVTPTYNIYNNIIYDATDSYTYGIRLIGDLTGFISNNTIVDLSGSTSGTGILGNGTGTGLWENNLVHNSQTTDFSTIASYTGNNNSSYDQTADDFSTGANNRVGKTADPFTGYASDDFTLAVGSDPIGNGKDLSGSFTDDFFGNTRSAWDIGAVEYQSGGGGADFNPRLRKVIIVN